LNSNAKQAVGKEFSIDSMQHARAMTWKVVDEVAKKIRPGMRESEANVICKEVLHKLGMDRIWHPILIRFGENTLKTFKEHPQDDPQLAENDISSWISVSCGTTMKAMPARPTWWVRTPK